MAGIYKITSPNGEIYIGQSRNIAQRIRNYRNTHKVTSQYKIQTSIIKHGWDEHNFEIIHLLPEGISEDVINSFEQYFIDYYFKSGSAMLNICTSAYSRKGAKSNRPTKGLGKKLTPEHIAKRSASLKETLSKQPRKKWSQESRDKASKSQKGRPHPKKGMPMHTEEQKAIWSKKRKGVKASQEARIKQSLARTGRKMSPEFCQKMSRIKTEFYAQLRQSKQK